MLLTKEEKKIELIIKEMKRELIIIDILIYTLKEIIKSKQKDTKNKD